jgi:hypothetical protein
VNAPKREIIGAEVPSRCRHGGFSFFDSSFGSFVLLGGREKASRHMRKKKDALTPRSPGAMARDKITAVAESAESACATVTRARISIAPSGAA